VVALIADVTTQIVQLRLADGERAVAILPREFLVFVGFRFNPNERAGFDLSSTSLLIASVRLREQAMWM
jgi:hypothetical protein